MEKNKKFLKIIVMNDFPVSTNHFVEERLKKRKQTYLINYLIH
jgi:CRISPR/Cas system-associated protein endoribonuclease Cas2